jgi:hypothetical protein
MIFTYAFVNLPDRQAAGQLTYITLILQIVENVKILTLIRYTLNVKTSLILTFC